MCGVCSENAIQKLVIIQKGILHQNNTPFQIKRLLHSYSTVASILTSLHHFALVPALMYTLFIILHCHINKSYFA